MILLDWTRMGRAYCLAGAVSQDRQWRVDAPWRTGSAEPAGRVELPLPDLGKRWLPVKDHHLLQKAEHASNEVARRLDILHAAVQHIGEQVAVRLGLSRAFPPRANQ